MPQLLIVSHHPRTVTGALLNSLHVAWLSPRPDVMGEGEDWVVRYMHLHDPEFRAQWRDIRRERTIPTVLLFNGLLSLASWKALALMVWNARGPRWPQIVYWHDASVVIRHFDGREGGTWAARWARRLHAKWIRRLIAGPRTTHWVVSRMVKQAVLLYLGVIPEHVTVVHEAIDITSHHAGTRRTEATDHPLRICGIGDPTYRKGLDLFVYAAVRLNEASPGAYEFVWYGAGRNDIAKWDLRWTRFDCLTVPVEWAGWTDDLPSAFRSCDAFFLSSRDDPFPIAALEALACDIPVFTLDTTGICEIIPSEFIGRNSVQLEERIRVYRDRRLEYAPGFFRRLAEPYDATPFRRLTEERLNIALPKP